MAVPGFASFLRRFYLNTGSVLAPLLDLELTIRGVVAVPLVRIGGGWGDLNSKMGVGAFGLITKIETFNCNVQKCFIFILKYFFN